MVSKCTTSSRYGKVVLVLNYTTTTPWRRVGEWMHRSTFSIGSSWRWVVSFMPRPPYSRYPFHMRLGGPQKPLQLHRITIFAWHCLSYTNYLTLPYKLVPLCFQVRLSGIQELAFQCFGAMNLQFYVYGLITTSSDCPHVSCPMLHTKQILITFALWLYSSVVGLWLRADRYNAEPVLHEDRLCLIIYT
jgi:hypothetical protein